MNNYSDYVILTLGYLLSNIRKLHSSFLFGSTALNKNKYYSDIDILLIWKKMPNTKVISHLKSLLIDFYGKKIDIVNMEYCNKIVKYSMSDKNFIDDIYRYCIPICLKFDKYDIYFSKILCKI